MTIAQLLVPNYWRRSLSLWRSFRPVMPARAAFLLLALPSAPVLRVLAMKFSAAARRKREAPAPTASDWQAFSPSRFCLARDVYHRLPETGTATFWINRFLSDGGQGLK